MSATLNLEFEKGMSFDAIYAALKSIDGCDLEDRGKELQAYFANSNVSVTLVRDVAEESVLTEDIENTDWLVGTRAYLEVDPSRENALDDIKDFIHRLADLTSFRFVLSFGYETLYAFRDTGSLFLSDGFK